MNGQEAVATVQAGCFDLVLMGVQMPEMDGLEATRLIREQEMQSGNHIPIIAMPTHVLKGDREKCLEAGMDEYVSKPIRAALFRDTICKVVGPKLATRPRADKDEMLSTGELDWSIAMDAVDGDSRLLRDVIEAFLEELPVLLEGLQRAIANSDMDSLGRTAHTLKGG